MSSLAVVLITQRGMCKLKPVPVILYIKSHSGLVISEPALPTTLQPESLHVPSQRGWAQAHLCTEIISPPLGGK